MADELDEIRSRIRLVDLVGQSVNLKRSGKDFSGLCPFHDDKNPSFRVSDRMGRYKCWSCNEAGDIFTWVMKTQNVGFAEAVEILARQAGVTLKKRKAEDPSLKLSWQGAMSEALAFFRAELAKSSEARSYCENRGIPQEVIDRWEIGYAPDVGEALTIHLQRKGYKLLECQKLFLVDQDPSGGYYDKFRGRLIFPIRDERGDLVAFGGRILGDGHPKYINSSDTPLYRKSRVLYGMNLAKQSIADGKIPVLCEGYLDVIACHRAGVESAVASLGTALSEEHAKMLKRWSKADSTTILYDADEAGERAAARAADILESEGLKVRVALMPAGLDPDTLLRKVGPGAVKQAAEEGLSPTAFKLRQIEVKLTPSDETFWKLVVESLAECRSDLELTRHIHELAPKYPDLRDPIEAGKALRRMVNQRRRDLHGRQKPESHQANPIARPKLGLKVAEATLFRAVLSTDLRADAWPAILDLSLFLTGKASNLAEALTSAFGVDPPLGAPADWLHRLQDDEMIQLLTDIDLTRDEKLNAEVLRDTIKQLEKRRDERAVQDVKSELTGDEKLKEIDRRLRKLKGDSREGDEN